MRCVCRITDRIQAVLCLCCLPVLIAGCATQWIEMASDKVGHLSAMSSTPKGYIPVSEICDAYRITADWDGVGEVLTLSKNGHIAYVMVDAMVAVIDMTVIELDEPLRYTRGILTVPRHFDRDARHYFGEGS